MYSNTGWQLTQILFHQPSGYKEVTLSRHLYTIVMSILWYKITTGTLTLRLRTDGDRLIPLTVPIS